MTVESKTTIELADISTVEFQCKECGFVASYSLNKFKNPPTQCGCGNDKQWMPHGGDTYAAITKMVEAMRRFSTATGEPFTMRFGLKGTSSFVPASDSKA